MKKLFTLIAITLFVYNVFAQAPQRLSYQAVIRNSTGGLVTNHAVGMKISILQGSESGTAVYVETHTPTTNTNGLATIEIGGGTLVLGNFSTINWGTGSYFLKTETDPAGGTSYTVVGTSQLLSVPYALNSKLSDGIADNSITSSKIVDGTITGADIGNNAVTSAKIVDNSIVTADLTDNIITPAKISNLAVTTDKLANTSVTMDKIANLAVTTGKLAAGSVTTEKINAGAVTGPKIAQAGAVNGQVLKWNNTTWAPGNDETGTGFSLPYSGEASDFSPAFMVTNSKGTAIFGKGLGGEAAYGVYGETNSQSYYGVYGVAVNGGTGGVRGVFGSTTGNGYGVFGSTISPEGFSGYFSGKFYVSGNIGFGESDPDCKLVVKAPNTDSQHMIDVRNPSGYPLVRMRQNSNGSGAIAIYPVNSSAANIWLYGDGNSYIKGGNLGVGTETPVYKVDVMGSIRATASVYYGGSEGSVNGTAYTKPDYVFEESYKVFGTEEVEEFLEKENHLPWITSSEKERKENGNATDMTRMAFETVETIENLQLQIIEQNKLIRELEARLKKLEAKGRR